tara:strand:- start:201 stop:563 length:363 start_codon:yes stop_codon:yes gene_type:complete
MTTSVSPLASPLNQRIVLDTALSSAVALNVTGASGRWWSIDIDNANAHTTYVRLWDNLNPTNGTTDPDWILSVAANTRKVVVVPSGASFLLGVSMAAVQDAGTAGTTAPAAPVVVKMVTE